MPAEISIVIPTLNAAEELAATSVSLMPGVTEGLIAELIVSDGGSEDATLEVARGLGARIVEGDAGRGGQIARGVEIATADWLLILHADTHLGEDWVEVAARHVADDPNKAGYFQLSFRATGLMPFLVAGGANLRSRIFGLPYGDQGLLIHRDLLAQVGGVPDVPLMEDVVLARNLRRHLIGLPAKAATSAARYERDGWVRRPARNLWTLARYYLGVSPARLVAGYEASSKKG